MLNTGESLRELRHRFALLQTLSTAKVKPFTKKLIECQLLIGMVHLRIWVGVLGSPVAVMVPGDNLRHVDVVVEAYHDARGLQRLMALLNFNGGGVGGLVDNLDLNTELTVTLATGGELPGVDALPYAGQKAQHLVKIHLTQRVVTAQIHASSAVVRSRISHTAQLVSW